MSKVFTLFVSEGHPDKVADQVSDAMRCIDLLKTLIRV